MTSFRQKNGICRAVILCWAVLEGVSGCYRAPLPGNPAAASSWGSAQSGVQETALVSTAAIPTQDAGGEQGPSAELADDVEGNQVARPRDADSAATADLASVEGNLRAGDGVPRAVVDTQDFDFGRMDPLERRSHTFVIRNEGTAPLTIRQGATSCKCTLGEVANNAVPPGGQTTVTLTWTTSKDKSEVFAQEAEIFTNDPENDYILFRIRGEIISELKIDPPLFALPNLSPISPIESTVTISSQIWDDFEISDVSGSLNDMTWDVSPVSSELASSRDIKSGYEIKIHAQNDMPRGPFSGWLRLNITPQGGEPAEFEIPIRGNVLRRVSIYGEGIDSTGTIKLGKVRWGKGLKRYFLVKVRDPDPILEVQQLETTPDFLKVSFLANEQVDKPGLYRMLLEIPKTAPPSVYMGQPGALRVEFANSRLEDLSLNVEFAVLGDRDF